jgi:hypothetical protein
MGPLFLLAAQRTLDTHAAGAASEFGPLFLHDQTRLERVEHGRWLLSFAN